MNTLEIIRTIVGIFFIIYGLGIYAYDIIQMKYLELKYNTINWFICSCAGIIIASYTFTRFLSYCLVAVIIWVVERKILKRQLKKS